MNKLISLEKAAALVKKGDSVMVGGFMTNGSPFDLLTKIEELNTKDLTLICNDAGIPDQGVGRLVVNKQFSHVLASHIGMNPELAKQMFAEEVEVQLIPQGTLAERIRAAGYGLGGILTPTGIGTEIQEGKQVINVEGKDYILEVPLKANVSLLYADKVDKMGNMVYAGSENNFNHLMAGAADITIVEAGEVVEVGELDPNDVKTPGVLVDYVVAKEVN